MSKYAAASFALAIFAGAFLLFQVQPIISRAILPWFGGAPSVWTTCVLVFQVLLFAGYAYAHLGASLLSTRWQAIVHGGLLCLAASQLPILPADYWKPTGSEQPTWHIIVVLLVSIGLPFFVLSASSPLLQAWYRRVNPAGETYRLYALSNLGSLLALLTFPFLVEPNATLQQQSLFWSGGFVIFLALAGVCGWAAATGSAVNSASADSRPSAPAESTSISWRAALLWFVLALVPSVLLLAITNQVCMDVAAVPFLWVMPLSLYLVSFILAFDHPRWYVREWYSLGVIVATCAITGMLISAFLMPIQAQVVVYFSGFFICAMYCHGELARAKPDARQLTAFYLILSAGGAAGGLFASVIAPLIFPALFELHLGLAAVAALAIWLGWPMASQATGKPKAPPQSHPSNSIVFKQAALVVGLVFIVVGLGYDALRGREGLLHQSRSFYGLLRVVAKSPQFEENHLLILKHGYIEHGRQFVKPEKRAVPTAYYGVQSGVGQVLQQNEDDGPRKVGVIGLGVGTLAAYAHPGDEFTFYEIDPHVIDIARQRFTYLADCRGKTEVIPGDARLVLERELRDEQPRRFNVLVIDAFSGDAIPTHLLTREALDVYLAHLKEDGVLAFHTSNRHFDLVPVVSGLAHERQLVGIVASSKGNPATATSIAEWVLLSRAPETFASGRYLGLPTLGEPRVPWSDAACNVFAVLRPIENLSDLLPKWDAGQEQEFEAIAEFRARGDHRAAARELQRLVERDPADPELWIDLGNSLRQADDPEGATRAYREALRLSPQSSDANNNLGVMLLSTDPDRAAELFQKAIQFDPRNAKAYVSVGNVLARRGQLAEALECYRRALDIEPDNREAQGNLQTVSRWQQEAAKP